MRPEGTKSCCTPTLQIKNDTGQLVLLILTQIWGNTTWWNPQRKRFWSSTAGAGFYHKCQKYHGDKRHCWCRSYARQFRLCNESKKSSSGRSTAITRDHFESSLHMHCGGNKCHESISSYSATVSLMSVRLGSSGSEYVFLACSAANHIWESLTSVGWQDLRKPRTISQSGRV